MAAIDVLHLVSFAVFITIKEWSTPAVL